MSTDASHQPLVCPHCRRPGAPNAEPGAYCEYDGTVLVKEAVLDLKGQSPLLGQKFLDTYAVFDILGRGGMGTVYKANHDRLNRLVAVKTIATSILANDEMEAEIRARFEIEARVLSALRHPNIVTVYDYGEYEDVLFMVLEHIGGESLWQRLRRESRLNVDEAVPIILNILSALSMAHDAGIIHRDIKPSNVMIEQRGDEYRTVLIDFGIAKTDNANDSTTSAPMTRTGVIVGTPKYMAPEQLKGDELGPWTDRYAVGCLLYLLLAGDSPYTGSRAEIAASHLRDAPPCLPPELHLSAFDRVIARAMAKFPADRYQSNKEFVLDLNGAWALSTSESDAKPTLPLSSELLARVHKASASAMPPPPIGDVASAGFDDGSSVSTASDGLTNSASLGSVSVTESNSGSQPSASRIQNLASIPELSIVDVIEETRAERETSDTQFRGALHPDSSYKPEPPGNAFMMAILIAVCIVGGGLWLSADVPEMSNRNRPSAAAAIPVEDGSKLPVAPSPQPSATAAVQHDLAADRQTTIDKPKTGLQPPVKPEQADVGRLGDSEADNPRIPSSAPSDVAPIKTADNQNRLNQNAGLNTAPKNTSRPLNPIEKAVKTTSKPASKTLRKSKPKKPPWVVAEHEDEGPKLNAAGPTGNHVRRPSLHNLKVDLKNAIVQARCVH